MATFGRSTCEQAPSRLQLMKLMEEQTIEELVGLGGRDWGVKLAELLGSHHERGLPESVPDRANRIAEYGLNKFEEKKLMPYWRYLLQALKDKIILILIFMATLELVVGLALGTDEERRECWIEPTAIYLTVLIIVNVSSVLDWKRERMFDALQKKVLASNLRFVVRDGKQLQVPDDDIVVGDIMSFNAHMAATISCDGILLSGDGVKTDESALTGEPEPISKSAAKPFMVSGTIVNAGQGKMLVVAVGQYSIAGKIRKAVYSDGDGEGDGEESPLFQKLDHMANQISYLGTSAACICFVAKMLGDYAWAAEKKPWKQTFANVLYGIGILAVAVPEGLPLALTISLAFCTGKLSTRNNLVKALASCETMGSATTICTDKTGTLTANKMSVRGAYIAGVQFPVSGTSMVGPRVVKDSGVKSEVKQLLGILISVCTMDESSLRNKEGKAPVKTTKFDGSTGAPSMQSADVEFKGNPTECALLKFAQELGFDYAKIRRETPGRSPESRDLGRARAFTSARKMMSWAVPQSGGGYRIFAKGASEIILARCTRTLECGSMSARTLTVSDQATLTQDVIDPFARCTMRTIGLAFRNVTSAPGDDFHQTLKNSDGTPALNCETDFTLVGVMAIEDPLRPEVGPAIAKCYEAGIDVRMVTGDNLKTAVAIAKQAQILDESLHCDQNGDVLPYRCMEGKAFRAMVHDYTSDGEAIFSQEKFDQIWPYLRVLARSSPEDKLTLAKGLRNSMLFQRHHQVLSLRHKQGITIFPDRQVVAMTGDGTNDAPALKSADVGFAMGIAGTQIAKDAADIILLDDNFASILIAAHWGRNVYDCVQMFLQFQLTVNIAILGLNLIVCWMSREVPLTVLQLLWLNLIMDSLASIALASEPPVEEQMRRPPVNRSKSIITSQMWLNMLGQAFYEIVATLVLFLLPHALPDCVPDDVAPSGTGPMSRHYTIVFNTFVLMQLFNEWNSRKLNGEFNIFAGITKNPTFVVVSGLTFIAQVIMVQALGDFAAHSLMVHPEGLTGRQWLLCLGVGAGVLVWQQVINVVGPPVSAALRGSKGCQAALMLADVVQVIGSLTARVDMMQQEIDETRKLAEEAKQLCRRKIELLDLEEGQGLLRHTGQRNTKAKFRGMVNAIIATKRIRRLTGPRFERQATFQTVTSGGSATSSICNGPKVLRGDATGSVRDARRTSFLANWFCR